MSTSIIVQHLDPWSRSTEGVERTRTMECILKVLENYYKNSIDNEVSVYM